MIKLSVVVAAYNVEKYIEECLESILDQTLKEIEVIVVNDGSTDATLEKIIKFKKNKKVKIINQVNSGIGNVRNKGIEYAQGKYITFVDGDDYLTNLLAYEHLIKELEKDMELEVITGGYNYVYPNSIKKGSIDAKIEVISGREHLIESIKQQKFSVVVWTKVYKLTFLKSNNLKFNEKEIINEDCNFNVKAFYLADKIKGTDIFYYGYRIHNSSVTRELNQPISRNLKKIKSYLSCANGLSDFFEKNKEENKILKNYQYDNFLRVFSKISFYEIPEIQKKEIFDLYKEKKVLERLRKNTTSLKHLYYYVLIKGSPKLYYQLKYFKRNKRS